MRHPDHERLLTRISEYLAFTPDAIQAAEVHALVSDRSISLNEAYLALLSARLGLDTEKQELLPLMICQHDPALYEADAYFQAVKPAVAQFDSIDLVYEHISPMELFVANDFETDAQGRILPQLGWFDRDFAFPAIREDGLVWMTITPNEINTIQPAIAQSRGKVLTYGLGLGYYAFHCLQKEDVASVTVVEKNPAVIDVFNRCLLPFFPRQQDLRIIQVDAFDYAAHVMPNESYDTVFTDLWRNVADGIPLYQRMKALEKTGLRYLYWMEKTLRLYME